MCVVKVWRIESAKLQAEQTAGAKADQTAQQSASGYVDRIVDPDIYLCVRNNKSPCKNSSPPTAGMAQCQEYEGCHGEMITGMGGGETGAYGAIIHEYPYIIGYCRVLAGAKPENKAFHPVAADQVAYDSRHDKGYGPPATFYFEIQGNKNQEE